MQTIGTIALTEEGETVMAGVQTSQTVGAKSEMEKVVQALYVISLLLI